MERHDRRRPAADDPGRFEDGDRFEDDEPEACPEPSRGAQSWDPADPLANPPWYDPPDPGDVPMPERVPPPLHPPEFPGLAVGGIVPAPEVSGFYYLSGAPVPPTHLDHGPMHLLPRKPDGGFAAYYYCSKAELQEWGIDHPPPLRHRHDGFTPEKIAIFIRTLRATGSVTDAARAAGITRKTAYDLYHRADAGYFRAAWDESLRGPNIVMTSTAYDRAINGVEEAVWYKGEFRGWRVRHDNRLLMFLLRVRDPLNFAPLDDLQGWLRHRDLPAHLPTEPLVDRLEAAERDWQRRLPQSEAAPAFPDSESRRRAAHDEAREARPALPGADAPPPDGEEPAA